MRTALYVFLALTAVPAFAGQTVWKWVDEKGVTHFSDQPVPGATKMELNSAPALRASPAPRAAPTLRRRPPTRPTGPAYSRLAVESPQQDETVINTGGKVTVRSGVDARACAGSRRGSVSGWRACRDFPPNAMSHELTDVHARHTYVESRRIDAAGRSDSRIAARDFPCAAGIGREAAGRSGVAQPAEAARRRNKLRTTQPTLSGVERRRRADRSAHQYAGADASRAPGGPKNRKLIFFLPPRPRRVGGDAPFPCRRWQGEGRQWPHSPRPSWPA